jgi:group I intron endonuclease
MEKIHYVYIITNLLNNHQYVGDRSVYNVDQDEYFGSGTLLKRKIKEYGRENFKKEILEFFKTRDEASIAQEKYIRLFKTHVSQGGYNLTWNGTFISEERNGKISRKLRNRIVSEETKMKLRGHFVSEETRKKQSEKAKLRIGSKNSMFGKERTIESKNKISESNISWHQTHDNPMKGIHRFGDENPMYGKHFSEESKNKISESNIIWHQTHDNALLGKNHSDEAKDRIREARKNSPKIVCPYCNKEADAPNYKRWHGDNCKNIKILI